MKKKLLHLPKKLANGFIQDECYLWASALSYYTLLSIVPVLAIVFGIAKGFGFEKALEDQILEVFYSQTEFASKLIYFAKSTLENARGSLIAGIGVIFLFWTSISILGNFEGALNKIWNVSKMRSLKEKIASYLPILILGPIIVIASSSLTFVMITKVIQLTTESGIYQTIKPAIHATYYTALFLLSWILFQFLFTYMPNKVISWKSTLLASFFTALAFQITQWAYIHLQIYLTSYNAIYGSLAAIPLFLLWLQTTWLIILAGAEFSKQYAYMREKAPLPISERGLFLLLMLTCCKAYMQRQPPYTSQNLADIFSIDSSIAEQALKRLRDTGLLIQLENDGAYIPAYPPNLIMLDEIFSSVDAPKDPLFYVTDSPERTLVVDLLSQWDLEQKNLPANTSIETLMG